MAENIPFLNVIARGVVEIVVSKGGTAESAMPSVMVAYAMSTIMTGVAFGLIGWFQLGQVNESIDTANLFFRELCWRSRRKSLRIIG